MKRGVERNALYYVSGLLGVLAVVGMSPILVPVALGHVAYRELRGRALKRRFRRTWGSRGKLGVFVYSDSPNWKDHIEAVVLPRVAERFVTLNWSRRSEWARHKPLEVQIFEHWSGRRAFNPMAILVPPTGPVSTLRFWEAFRAFKHGSTHELERQEALLFEAAGRPTTG
jgi:hypothetical protein